MGFRNPFRIQVDENDVAYVSDYSPDAQTPQRWPRPGAAPAASRSCASRPTTAGRRATSATSRTTSGTSTSSRPTPPRRAPRCTTRRSCTTATARRSATTRCGTSRAARRVEPGLRDVPPVTNPDIWYSYRDNNTAAPLGTPCLAYYAPTPGPIAPGSTTECPRLFPELYTGGVGPHGMTKYDYDPANPNPKKFPAVLRRLGDLRRVDAGHAARDEARRQQQHPEDQQLPGLRQPRERRRRARSCSSATTRWTCSSGPTARSTC